MERCKKITELFGAYIYGDLSPEEMHRVRMHVEECEACAGDLDARSRVLDIVPRQMPVLSDEDRRRIMWTVKGAIRAKNEPARSRFFSSVYVRGFAVTAVVVAAFAAGTLIGLRKPPKIIVKQVPVKHQPIVVKEPKERSVEQPAPVDVVPTIPEPQAIATDLFRRDRLPNTYRGGIEPRSPKPLDAVLTPPENLTSEDIIAPLAPAQDVLVKPSDSSVSNPKPVVPDNSP